MRILLVLLLSLSFSFHALANAPVCSSTPKPAGGDPRPWPWGFETPFPWTRIQGIWAPTLQDGTCSTYFVFKVGNKTDDGSRVIRITEYDPTTCRKIASGVGVETEKVIYAQMTTGKSIFNLAVRAFDPAVLNNPLCLDSTSDESVIVLSMYPKSEWRQGTSYELQKLRSSTALICDEQ